MPTFGYVLADSGIFRVLAQLHIFMYIKAYSDQNLRLIKAYSEPLTGLDTTQEQFMHILNLN